jgi:diacylglycerol kinase
MNKHKRYNLIKSFGFAFSGIFRSLKYERNLRIHFSAAIYVLYFSRYFTLSRTEYAVLILAIGGVIARELINTAIEASVDLKTPAPHVLAKTAKDAAAGGVLISSLTCLVIGVLLFWQPLILSEIWADITKNLFIWIFLLALTVFLIAWPESLKPPKAARWPESIKLPDTPEINAKEE